MEIRYWPTVVWYLLRKSSYIVLRSCYASLLSLWVSGVALPVLCLHTAALCRPFSYLGVIISTVTDDIYDFRGGKIRRYIIRPWSAVLASIRTFADPSASVVVRVDH